MKSFAASLAIQEMHRDGDSDFAREKDALTPAAMVKQLPAMAAASGSTVTVIPNAGHMVHFDEPAAVRSIVVSTMRDCGTMP